MLLLLNRRKMRSSSTSRPKPLTTTSKFLLLCMAFSYYQLVNSTSSLEKLRSIYSLVTNLSLKRDQRKFSFFQSSTTMPCNFFFMLSRTSNTIDLSLAMLMWYRSYSPKRSILLLKNSSSYFLQRFSPSVEKMKVTKPGALVWTEHSCGLLLTPDISAMARARAFSAPISAMSSLAASSKYSKTPQSTFLILSMMSLERALMTSLLFGSAMCLKRMLAIFYIQDMRQLSRGLQKVTQTPFFPALPVRPARCTQSSTLLGGSSWMIRSTEGMSSPLAATLVAMRHFTTPFLKFLKVSSRIACEISPCRMFLICFIVSEAYSSLASFLVSQKIITLPTAPAYIVTRLQRAQLSALRSLDMQRQRCSMVVEVLISKFLMRSTVLRLRLMKVLESSSTQRGMVAEKSIFCILRGQSLLINSRICSTSYWKPSFSISSASSKQTLWSYCRFRDLRERKSISLPGVAAMISTPLRMKSSCWCMGLPPQTVSIRNYLGWIFRLPISLVTWIANSLVGRMMINLGLALVWLSSCWSRSLSRMGREQAIVFPEPVRSLPTMSLPQLMASQVSYWMGKKYLMPLLRSSCSTDCLLIKQCSSSCSSRSLGSS